MSDELARAIVEEQKDAALEEKTRRRITPKIPCPHCGDSESFVMNTRPALAQEGVKRTRRCKACNKPYRTVEILEAKLHLDDSSAA